MNTTLRSARRFSSLSRLSLTAGLLLGCDSGSSAAAPDGGAASGDVADVAAGQDSSGVSPDALAADGVSPGSDVAGADDTTSMDTTSTDTAPNCECFEAGQWQIDNISPCFQTNADGAVTGATSTAVSGGSVLCPTSASAAPSEPWSTSTLTSDCAGRFRLCYTLTVPVSPISRAPECQLAQACAEGDYATPGSPQAWAALPSWIATGDQVACAVRFAASGGLGTLSVTGTPTGCDEVEQVLATIRYCPAACAADPAAAGCKDCVPGGDGHFGP